MKLEGMVAIVTGGAGGIGRGIVRCLAEEGADVAIADINLEGANKVVEEVRALGCRALAIRADATKAADAQRAATETLETWGKIDILVNNVGGQMLGETKFRGFMMELEEEDWDFSYQIDLKSQVNFCKAVLPHMMERRYGKIVNISSIEGKTGNMMLKPYSAMKAGVIAFTRSLAREMARDNINVNAICPGLIWTATWEALASKMWKRFRSYADMEPRQVFLAFVKERIPLGREQTPEDIGRAVVFLASEDAKNITGQSLNVDGGQVMD